MKKMLTTLAAALATHLQAQGYVLVELFEQEPEDGDAAFHVLHVERVEVHDETSLDKRNQELSALATQMGVEDYDGMDVGPAPTLQ